MSEENTTTEESVTESSAKSATTEESVKAQAAVTYSSETKTKSDYKPVKVDLKSLLQAGAHFGHQVQRWNPKMLPFIYGERNGVHIINLDKTLERWEKAEKCLRDIGNRGGTILFVGTKQQAKKIVKGASERCSSFSVTHRWLGGTLSNFETIKRSIARMKKLEELLAEAESEDSKVKFKKKEKLSISRDLQKLEANLGGIRHMRRIPDALFIVDINKEDIAVAEARKLHIPVIALVDTNVDPNTVDFPIPSNDDSSKTLQLFINAAADAYASGRESFLMRAPDEQSGNGNGGESPKKRGSKRQQTEIAPEGGSSKDDSKTAEQAPVASSAV